MAATDVKVTELAGGPRPQTGWIAPRLMSGVRAFIARMQDSEYHRVGGSRRYRAYQRRRTRTATRVGMLVLAVAAVFDGFALLGLGLAPTQVAVLLDGVVLVGALAAWWLLRWHLRRHPEPIALIATIGIAVSTVTTGMLVPSLAVQTAAYLLLIPGLVALLLPWSTRTHVRWLLVYAVIGFYYFTTSEMPRFSAVERGDLDIVFGVAVGASLVGHVLLQRAQITNFAQLMRIGSLRRKSEADMIELGRLHDALERTARTDPLTGVGNRRRLDDDLRAVRAHVRRSGSTYGILEIDLDHFKSINDRLGHAAGDDVLRRVAQALERSLRAGDAVYRIGGEEFVVVLHSSSVEGTAAASERSRAAIVGLEIEHPDNPPHGIVTVSIGATVVGPTELDQTDERWIARADDALYEAKRAGRNRAILRDGSYAP